MSKKTTKRKTQKQKDLDAFLALSPKERGFVKDILAGKTGVEAAMNNYNIGGKHGTKNPAKVAGVMAAENLAKPRIKKVVKSMAERLPDDYLEKHHKKLMEKKTLSKISVKKTKTNTISKVKKRLKDSGIEVISVWEDSDRIVVLYKESDTQAVRSALDMAYKIKASYAPERRINLNINDEARDKARRALGSYLNNSRRND